MPELQAGLHHGEHHRASWSIFRGLGHEAFGPAATATTRWWGARSTAKVLGRLVNDYFAGSPKELSELLPERNDLDLNELDELLKLVRQRKSQ